MSRRDSFDIPTLARFIKFCLLGDRFRLRHHKCFKMEQKIMRSMSLSFCLWQRCWGQWNLMSIFIFSINVEMGNWRPQKHKIFKKIEILKFVKKLFVKIQTVKINLNMQKSVYQYSNYWKTLTVRHVFVCHLLFSQKQYFKHTKCNLT